MPKTFTKPHRGERSWRGRGSRRRAAAGCDDAVLQESSPAARVWKVSHSETKPFSGGSAEIASAPIRK